VLTRPWPGRHQELEAALAVVPEAASMHMVYVDLPHPLGTRDWDPFLRGHQVIEYMLWQLVALRTARRIARQEEIDFVWHLTFANVWMGSIAGLVGPVSVLGPVGGGVGSLWRLVPGFGRRGIVSEVIRTLVRSLARYINPLARVAWSRASLILVQNPETKRWLPASVWPRTEVFHNPALEDTGIPRIRGRPAGSQPVAIFVGRLLPWKGARLAVRAIARLPDWRLLIVGSGPEEGPLRELVKRLAIEDRVEFRGWVPHAEVVRAMGEDADVFLFPSTHDEASFAVAEALAAGLPVVCLDHGGPPVVGGRPVKVGSQRQTIERLALALEAAAFDSGPLPPPPTIEERRRGVVEILSRHGIIAGPSKDAL
jgi:glycosyltransferase involved in cell wall biosynthesis